MYGSVRGFDKRWCWWWCCLLNRCWNMMLQRNGNKTIRIPNRVTKCPYPVLLHMYTSHCVWRINDEIFATSSYFLSASSAINFACANCCSKMPTLSSSILVRFSRAFRILFQYGQYHYSSKNLKYIFFGVAELYRAEYLWSSDSFWNSCQVKYNNFRLVYITYRSLSSAAWDASESLAVADAKRSSERSKSSSSNWMRRLRAATSDSA